MSGPKVCANCGTWASRLQRKCKTAYCKGDIFRAPTDEETEELRAQNERAQILLAHYRNEALRRDPCSPEFRDLYITADEARALAKVAQ